MSNPKYPQIIIRITPFEYKKFLSLKEKHGVTAKDIFLAFCSKDVDLRKDYVIVRDRITGQEVKIERGIVSKK